MTHRGHKNGPPRALPADAPPAALRTVRTDCERRGEERRGEKRREEENMDTKASEKRASDIKKYQYNAHQNVASKRSLNFS